MHTDQDTSSLSSQAFRARYGFSGKESILRITAKRTGAYDAANDRYIALPLFLETLVQEKQIPPLPIALAPSEPLKNLSDKQLSEREFSLDDLVLSALRACSRDPSLRSVEQPCRGDVQVFLQREKQSPLEEQGAYSGALIPHFIDYWKKTHRRRDPIII